MSKKSFYPHMIVGNFKKYNTENIIKLECQEQAGFLIDIIDFTNNSIYQNSTNKLQSLKNFAIDYKNNSSEINSSDQLFGSFPNFKMYISLLGNETKFDEFLTQSEEFENINKYWDCFLCHYIINIDKDLIYNLSLAIKLLYLLNYINLNRESITFTKVMDYWKLSKIILPKPVFPLPKKIAGSSDAGYFQFPTVSTNTSTNIQNILDEIEIIKSARKDILDSYDSMQVSSDRKLSEENFKKYISNSISKVYEEVTEDPSSESIQEFVNSKYSEYTNKPLPLNENFPIASLLPETQEILSENNLSSTYINIRYVIKRLDSIIESKSTLLTKFAPSEKVVNVGNTLISVYNSVYENSFCENQTPKNHCDLLKDLVASDPKKAVVQVLGVGDANIIKQELKSYEVNEIADIENIFSGEEKTKTHRNLKRQEDYVLKESETTEETSTDNKTSERFDIAKEVNKITNSNDQMQTGSSITSSFGPVVLSANVGYATQSASNENTNTTVNNAKEITQQAVHSIQERILERRSSLSISEIEITNVHLFKNLSTNHKNGFYYWVDKVYENQVYNIGKRLMLEFLVPEPAAFHVYSNAFSKKEGINIEKPIDPRDYYLQTPGDRNSKFLNYSLKSHRDITRDNYHIWAAIYKAPDINPPPMEFITISKAFNQDEVPGSASAPPQLLFTKSESSISIKEGYSAKNAYVSGSFNKFSPLLKDHDWLGGFIGNNTFNFTAPFHKEYLELDDETTSIPLSIIARTINYIINIEIQCQLTPLGIEKWQIETYNAIMNAYNKQKAEYDNAISSMETNVFISGQNPAFNRKIEKTELKKWGIELLTLQRFCGFDAMKRAIDGVPEMSFDEAKNEGPFIKFFEQAIDWNNMTYIFYPYFWSDKKRWNIIKNLSDNDTAFTDFLQAGYARVVVPVQPKFTEAILHYLNSGEIWLGEEMPGIDDELYLSIIDEIKTRDGNQEEIAVGEPWDTRVPTNLIMLTDIIPANLPGYTS